MKVVELLLRNGADVNAIDEKKQTALHWVAISGEYLIEYNLNRLFL